LVTGRHPQTTGHVINDIITRHDEISIGDAFARAGYRTGWVGKWHLHVGSWPPVDMTEGEGPSYIPEGRDRLGFQFWRAYNLQWTFFNGWVNKDDWHNERWQGYETEALNRYAFEFLDSVGDAPFCLFVSPHQPHYTLDTYESAPAEYYERLPNDLTLPGNVAEDKRGISREQYRHYLAMIMAVDDMVGQISDYLERTGKAENTLLIFTSDHGSQFGAHGFGPWRKCAPYGESVRVPLIARWPRVLAGGSARDALIAPVDLFPTLCGLCGVAIPQTVEGYNLADAWLGKPGAYEQDAVLTMNFSSSATRVSEEGNARPNSGRREWRGVRTRQYAYTRWLNGNVELFDVAADPLEQQNLAGDPTCTDVRNRMAEYLRELLAKRGDKLQPSAGFRCWYDNHRRVVRNAYGALPHPEDPPDWSLLA